MESKDLEARIASLALNPNEKVKNALFNDPKAITFPLLKPGMLVQACIESVVEVCLNINLYFSLQNLSYFTYILCRMDYT